MWHSRMRRQMPWQRRRLLLLVEVLVAGSAEAGAEGLWVGCQQLVW